VISIGVIGYGYWGPNLVRNFADQDGARVVAVGDLRAERLANLSGRYPEITRTTDYRDMLANPAVDAVVIATPVGIHFTLAMQALQWVRLARLSEDNRCGSPVKSIPLAKSGGSGDGHQPGEGGNTGPGAWAIQQPLADTDYVERDRDQEVLVPGHDAVMRLPT